MVALPGRQEMLSIRLYDNEKDLHDMREVNVRATWRKEDIGFMYIRGTLKKC